MRISDAVRDTIGQDGAVLLDTRQGLCFSMNPVGARIWQLLKEGNSPDVIVDVLKRECNGVSRTQLAADVREFLSDLKAKDLLRDDNHQTASKKPNLLLRLFSYGTTCLRRFTQRDRAKPWSSIINPGQEER